MKRSASALVRVALLLAAAVGPTLGCDSKPQEEPAPAVPRSSADEIPLSTSSAAARDAFLRGRDLVERFRFQEAREALLRAVEADPNFALAHLLLAQTAPSTRELLAAVDRAHSLSERASPGEKEWILGFLAGVREDSEGQLAHYRRVVELHPRDPRARQLLGSFLFALQRLPEAIAEYQAAIELDPSFSAPYNALGYAHRGAEDYQAAERAFRRYIELLPDESNPYDSYAELLLKTGRYEESIEQYREALERDSEFAASYYGIASNLVYLGRNDEARAEIARLLASDPHDGERRHARLVAAATWADEGRYDRALEEIRAAREIAASNGDAAALAGDQEVIGILLLEAGRVAEARQAFEESRRVIDASTLGDEIVANARRSERFHRARLALAEGDLSAAREHAVRYREEADAMGSRYLIWSSRLLDGLVAQAEQRWADALTAFDQANPHDTYALFRKAQVLEATGERDEARRVYLAAAGFNPLLDLNHAYVRRAARGAAERLP